MFCTYTVLKINVTFNVYIIDMGYGAYIIFAKFRILFPDTLAKLGTLGYLCVSVGCQQCNHYNQT